MISCTKLFHTSDLIMLIKICVIVALSICSAGALDEETTTTPPPPIPTPLNYTITTTWDGDTPPDNATISLSFRNITTENTTGLLIEIDAPFYNDPIVPPHLPVGSTDMLWNYEVVEVFFLSESEQKYLETEFAPKGHYLLLTLDTDRNIIEYELPLNGSYSAEVDEEGGRWRGRAVVPWEYLPRGVNKFNGYAIHRSDPGRVYMSLFPVGKGEFDEPNFHRLQFFGDIDLGGLREVE